MAATYSYQTMFNREKLIAEKNTLSGITSRIENRKAKGLPPHELSMANAYEAAIQNCISLIEDQIRFCNSVLENVSA